mgnify:CR=1 FL=1
MASKRKLPIGSSGIVEFWKNRIRRAKADREACEKDWIENQRILNASDYVDEVFGAATPHVWENIQRQILDVLVPSIVFKNPEFSAVADREEDERTARLAEINVNWAMRIMDIKNAAKECVQDALVCSFGVISLGWVLDFKQIEARFTEAGLSVEDNSRDKPLSAVKEELLVGLGNRPFGYRVSPLNFLRSRGSTCIQNASWVAERMFIRREDAAANPFFENVDKVRSGATFRTSTYDIRPSPFIRAATEQITAGQALADPDDEPLEIWAIWDRSGREMLCIAEECDVPVHAPDAWPYELAGLYPFGEFRLFRLNDEPYPLPYLSVFKQQVKAMNMFSVHAMDHISRAGGKVAYNASAVDESDIEKFRNGDPIPCIAVKMGDPERAFANVPGPALNPDIRWIKLMLQESINMASHVGEFFRGGSVKELATQTSLRAESYSIVVDEFVDRVADSFVGIARVIDLLSRKFIDRTQEVNIAGATGHEWVRYSKHDLMGAYSYQMVPNSTRPINKDILIQQQTNALNILGPFIPPGSMALNGGELVRPLLQALKMNPDKVLQSERPPPPADPREENMLLLAGGNPVVSPLENFEEHLQSHVAMAQILAREQDPDETTMGAFQYHIQQTQQLMQAKQMAEQQAMLAAQQGASPGSPLSPGTTGSPSEPQPGVKRGPGNGGPATMGALRPRALSEDNPTLSNMMGVANRLSPLKGN